MDFIIISTADWDNPFWTNKQHIAKTLGDMGHRVLYIDSLGMRTPTATPADFKRIFQRLHKLFCGIKHVENNIWIMSPFSIPLQKYSFIRSINKFILPKMINYTAQKLNFKNIILWTYNPLTSYLINNVKNTQSVYHCVDEISAQPGMPKEIIKIAEISLLKKADITFVTTLSLLHKKEKYTSTCFYYPNVADFKHFNLAYSHHFERPNDLPSNQKPIIGFIGAISGYKQNFKLLAFLAASCPNYNIVLIGKIGEGEPQTDYSILKQYSNIILLGPKNYSDLPQYLSYFCICILPCCINEYTKYMFPMKFFEYLSAGKPIVSTDIPAIHEFNDYCYIAKTNAEFVFFIKKALKEDCAPLQHKRISLASQYTYISRMKKMLEKIVAIKDTSK